MKEARNFDDIRENELRSRQEQRSTLESLLGFSRLSPNQKRYITTSLYLQQRAERGTDFASAARITITPDKFRESPSDPYEPYITSLDIDPSVLNEAAFRENQKRYHNSQLNVMGTFCHQAIAILEEYRQGELKDKFWIDAGPIKTYADLEELVALSEDSFSFPFVIQIWAGKPTEDNLANLIHSTLLLGRNDKDELIVWEKSGWHMPFQLLLLSNVHKKYPRSSGWRIRPLSV